MRALAVLLLLVAASAQAQLQPPRPERAADAGAIPLPEAIARAQARFRGEVIAAEIAPGRPHERAAAVHALRLLTPEGALLRLRFDAADGRFLEAEGRELADARRRRAPGGDEAP